MIRTYRQGRRSLARHAKRSTALAYRDHEIGAVERAEFYRVGASPRRSAFAVPQPQQYLPEREPMMSKRPTTAELLRDIDLCRALHQLRRRTRQSLTARTPPAR